MVIFTLTDRANGKAITNKIQNRCEVLIIMNEIFGDRSQNFINNFFFGFINNLGFNMKEQKLRSRDRSR